MRKTMKKTWKKISRNRGEGGGGGVRTHAYIRTSELKSIDLTTRPFALVYCWIKRREKREK